MGRARHGYHCGYREALRHDCLKIGDLPEGQADVFGFVVYPSNKKVDALKPRCDNFKSLQYSLQIDRGAAIEREL